MDNKSRSDIIRDKVNADVAGLVLHGSIIASQPRRHGTLTGVTDGDTNFKGVPVEVRSDVPPGKIYLVSQSSTRQPDGMYRWSGQVIDTRTRWQHFRDWLKGKLIRP